VRLWLRNVIAPLIPYFEVPELVLVRAGAWGNRVPSRDVALYPFGAFVALSVWLGILLTLKQARRVGLSSRATLNFALWIVVGGFVGGHLGHLLLYQPSQLASDPWALLEIANGQSSLGGFAGAVGAMLLWSRRFRVAPWSGFSEALCSSLPAAWTVGRLGCAVAHDHPGVRSDSPLAVVYPDGGRWDLGLAEAVLVLPLAIVFLVLRRQPRSRTFFARWTATYYLPLRFFLDFLRARHLPGSDPRYWGLTSVQWACLALMGFGIRHLCSRRQDREKEAQ